MKDARIGEPARADFETIGLREIEDAACLENPQICESSLVANAQTAADVSKSSLRHLLSLRSCQLERGRTAGNPNDVTFKGSHFLSISFKPATEPYCFSDHDFDFRVAGGVQLSPVDHLGVSIGVLIGDCEVPAVGIRFGLLQRRIDVNTPNQLSSVFSFDVQAVLGTQRLKSFPKLASKGRCSFYRVLESHAPVMSLSSRRHEPPPDWPAR